MAQSFKPKPGQIDYTAIRYAPVVHIIVVHATKLLMVQRSQNIRLYPGLWSGITGFLDDNRAIEAKVFEELNEELGLQAIDIALLTVARPLRVESPELDKTWLVVPVRADITTNMIRLDWEAATAKWQTPSQAKKLSLVPGTIEVLAEFFPEVI